MRKLVTSVAAAAILLVPQLNLMAQDDEALAVIVPGGGTYSRAITTDSAQAQAFFDQGLRMAWSFYFPESIASYQEAARLDPDSPMPHFGLAHAAGPNPNSRYGGLPDDPQGAGLAAIRRALALANNGSLRERDMINALFVLYNKDAIPDSRERDFAFVDAMRNLHDKYPDDPDIAAIFGESYMNTTRWDYWDEDGAAKPGTAEAQAAFESAMRSEPNHPGSNHLYIHLMEASAQPELAMPAAQKLEATVPISGHMVHMPGHIYLRVGEYEKAIDINERSQIVDAQFAEIWGDTNFPLIGTYPLSHKIHKGHALDFVRYANMLQGNYAAASEAATRNAGNTDPDITSGLKNIAHTWITDKVFGKWDKIHADNAANSQYEAPYLKGMWSYVMGSAHVAKGHMGPAEAQLANLQAQITADGVDDNGVRPTPASHVLNLASHALNGEIEEAKGNLDAAAMHYNLAIQLQDSLNYTEPPDWSQSMRLYLGAVLLDAGRAVEAEEVYRKDLEWNRQNAWTTFGLSQALEAQGKTQEAIIVERQFQSFFRNADVEITRSRL
jgi:tetratricopeptide (TPR) repeat protein|tara:strand:+ start:205 stop:1869 length:1665 start_codon:yes stop_codon:yes gene_type:complete